MKYQPRAPEIDAIQWRGDNNAEVAKFADTEVNYDVSSPGFLEVGDGLFVELLDWIVKGDEDELTVIGNAEFVRNYEPCDKRLVAAGGME